MVKKAQNGTKATKDSTQYFKNEKELRLDLAINQSKFGLPKASKENAKKAVQAINDGARQAYKGKPGFDANGYPKKKMGGMIKRADGSTSQRGLWDNIRANKGSGKKPTSEMLKQEKKIKAKKAEEGTMVDKGMTRTGEVKKRSSPGEELKGFYKRDFLKADSAKTKTGEVLRKVGNTAIKAAFTPQALMTAGMRTGGPRKANKSDLDKIPEKKMGGKVIMKTKKK